MQTRNFNQCKTDEYIRYPRAGRVDAEPITRRFQMRLLALLFCLEVSICLLTVILFFVIYC